MHDQAATATVRSRLTLARGVLVFRWVTLIWMGTIALTSSEPVRRPGLAWASIALAVAWTAWLTVDTRVGGDGVLILDLIVCAWLVIASGLVVPEGQIVAGRPFFATGYPFSAALLWGVVRGPVGGLVAGGALGLALVATRPLNGVPLQDLDGHALTNVAGAVVNFLVAGAAVGLVSRLLVRSSEVAERATTELVKERERAARLAERESLARELHDSVLQALALVHKRGRELAGRDTVPGSELARLSEVAGRQEAELRALVMRSPEDAPVGTLSLRGALEETARRIDGIGATVSTVGPIRLDAHRVQEITAAVRQALENVAEHARAERTSVFAEEDDGVVVVSVRDDGTGFVYDEDDLRARGKAGMLKSMKGRVEDLGGRMQVTSGRGEGTEIEFRVPKEG